MSQSGAYGAMGWCSIPQYYIVDANVKYCKATERSFVSIELANDIIKENGWGDKNVIVISDYEFTQAWNKRFA